MMASDEEESASNFDGIRFQQPHPLNERNGSAPEWVDQGGSGEGRASREHMSPCGPEQQMRSGSKPRDEPDRNILPERENKSNITKMPDRNQVLSRLNQIRDYINQTTSLMDRMQNSRDPRVAVEYCKLTKMLLGLQDSERKLQDLLSTLKNLAECGEMDITGGCMGKVKQGNPDIRSNPGSSGRNLSHDNEMNSPVANSSFNSGDLANAVTKSTEAGHRNELRVKMQKPETEQATPNEGINTAQDLVRPPVPELTPVLRKGKLDHLKERIQALKELYENRNQLMELLGDEDEELSSEHHALQNKLEDLQQKKSQMDQLVQELRNLNSFIPEDDIVPEAMNESRRNEGTENEMEQPEHDIQEVLKNMEELKQMKERLAILQGMMSATTNQSQETSGNDGAVGGHKEDSAVNRRQDRETSREPPNSSKPDNISLSSEAGSVSNADARQLYISTQELERKTLKLQEAKHRLQQLEKLLDVMQDNQKEGGSLTAEHYEQLIQAVGDDEAATSCGVRRDGSKDREVHMNFSADDQSLYSNSRKSPQKRYDSSSPRESGSFHGNQQIPELPRSRSSSTHGSMDHMERRQNRATSPLASELSVEALNAITQNLREQAMTIRNERDRLAQVKWQISQKQRSDPAPPQSPPPSSSVSTSSASSFVHRVKNRNAMGLENQSCRQLFLQSELQAKRRELEELMKKDRGHQTSINQDVCSEISARKAEATGFIHGAVEGTTTNATWGGSTQGTLDDLVERDIVIQDQSGEYSSDEGQNDDETKEVVNFQQASSFQEQRIAQLNVSMAREQPNVPSQSSQRDMLNISLESQGRPKASVISNNNSSNTSSTVSNMNSSMPGPSRSSRGRSPVRLSQVQNLQQAPQHSTPTRNQMSSSHNIWKKDSHEGTAPRAVWTPSSRQENLCSADELVTDVGASTAAGQASPYPPMPSASHHQPQCSIPPSSTSWWQQQAQHLQNQLEATSSLCQSLMTEQQHHGGGGPGCTLPGVPSGYNLAHPIGFATPQTAPSWAFPNMSSPWMAMTPPSLFPSPDHSPSSLTLHSCTSHQLQQQQVLLTLSQCCHLLWLQHRELATLQATVQGIQDKVGRESRSALDEDELRSMQMQHTQLQQPQVHPHAFPNRGATPNTQHSSYPLPMPQSLPSNSRRLQKPSHHPATFPDASREVMASTDMSAAGVSSAHSLPNLCASGTSMMGLLPQTASPGATYSYPPPEHLPPPPLGAASYAHTDPWALHPNAAARGPPVALNNQVPPGIRANNYWDNFRR